MRMGPGGDSFAPAERLLRPARVIERKDDLGGGHYRARQP